MQSRSSSNDGEWPCIILSFTDRLEYWIKPFFTWIETANNRRIWGYISLFINGTQFLSWCKYWARYCPISVKENKSVITHPCNHKDGLLNLPRFRVFTWVIFGPYRLLCFNSWHLNFCFTNNVRLCRFCS